LERVDRHNVARVGQRDCQGAVSCDNNSALDVCGLEGHELEHGFVDHATGSR